MIVCPVKSRSAAYSLFLFALIRYCPGRSDSHGDVFVHRHLHRAQEARHPVSLRREPVSTVFRKLCQRPLVAFVLTKDRLPVPFLTLGGRLPLEEQPRVLWPNSLIQNTVNFDESIAVELHLEAEEGLDGRSVYSSEVAK